MQMSSSKSLKQAKTRIQNFHCPSLSPQSGSKFSLKVHVQIIIENGPKETWENL